MSLAPAIESALRAGGILLVDELERELHPVLVDYIIVKFQSKVSNPNGAQIAFTTHKKASLCRITEPHGEALLYHQNNGVI